MIKEQETDIIIGADSENCNIDWLKSIHKFNSRTNIHLSLMGKNAKELSNNELKDVIPLFTSSYITNSVGFNYPLAINIVLANLNNDKLFDRFMVLIDGYCSVNVAALYYEHKKGKGQHETNFNTHFSTIRTYYDYQDDDKRFSFDRYRDIDEVDENLGRAIIERARAIKKIKDSGEFVPIIICKLKYLVHMINGLEEEMFTEMSRIHLIHQLKKFGLKEKSSRQTPSLCFRYDNQLILNDIQRRDLILYNKIQTKDRNVVFIPNNLNNEFGDTHRISKMIVTPDNIPTWYTNSEYQNKILSDRYNKQKGLIDTFNEPRVQKNVTPIKVTSTKFNPDKHSLILVNSNLRDIAYTVPFIKDLNRLSIGKIDILTDDKLRPSLYIINDSRIRNIYDVKDIKSNLINLNSYDNIFRTLNCNLNIGDYNCFYPSGNSNNHPVKQNHSMIAKYDIDESVPNPYCKYTIPKSSVFKNMIVLSGSHIKGTNALYLKNYIGAISKLSNDQFYNFLIISLIDEQKINFPPHISQKRNVRFINNIDFIKLAGYICISDLSITTNMSNMMYLSYLTKKNSLVYTHSDYNKDLPNSNWIKMLDFSKLNDYEDIEMIVGKLI